MAKGSISHIEFPADDLERSKRFYGAVAGWQFGPMEGLPEYELFQTGETTGGAIGKRAVSAAEANGGTVVTPPSPVPGFGRYAAVLDPEGNEIGLFEGAPSGG